MKDAPAARPNETQEASLTQEDWGLPGWTYSSQRFFEAEHQLHRSKRRHPRRHQVLCVGEAGGICAKATVRFKLAAYCSFDFSLRHISSPSLRTVCSHIRPQLSPIVLKIFTLA